MKNPSIKETLFEELFKKNYNRLFYYAYDWVEDEDTAKDLVSDLFGDLWNRYDILHESNLEAYLFKSLRNRCLNFLKHLAVEKQYQSSVLEMKEEVIDEDESRHEENLKKIEQTIDNFTPQTKAIFELCYFEGKTYQETAEAMGISTSAVHKHMNKAFTAFRLAFNKKMPERVTE